MDLIKMLHSFLVRVVCNEGGRPNQMARQEGSLRLIHEPNILDFLCGSTINI